MIRQIPLGQSSTVYVTPTVTETDRSGQSLSEAQRGCRLRQENGNLEIFREYSREACMMECQLQQAVRRCGCQPWDYPFYHQDDLSVCDMFGNICFDKVMKTDGKDLCDLATCPMDCSSISYSYSIVSSPFIPDELCPSKGTDSIFEEFYNNQSESS